MNGNEVAVQAAVEADISGFEMKPRTLEEAMKFCEIMANSDLVPKDYKGKPGNIMVAIQMGAELGMSPMRSLRSIAVINGRASQWGDDMLAMVLASPVCEYVHEQDSTEEEGVCEVKRRGDPKPHRSTFSLADARRAGLLGKQGTWQTNPKRMLQLRARGFALRDKFTDVLAGLITAEEAMDLPPVEAEAGAATILQMNQPLTLKDKLKAKVEAVDAPAAVIEPTVEEVLEEMKLSHEDEVKQYRQGKLAGEPAFDDPTEPYRKRIEAATSAQEATREYNATPETLRQDVFKDYQKALQGFGKKK